jgi:pimeloyl-ACP methyl ester carboxylesterase
MKAQQITITASDGVELAAIAVRPQEPTTWGAVLIHGICLNHREPLNLAVCSMLASQGVLALSVDMRWHDGYDPKVVRTSTFEETIDDLKGSIDWLEQQGANRVFLIGHSLGSIRSAYYQRLTGDARVASLIFLEPARVDFNFHRTLRAYWGKEADAAFAWAKDLVAQGKGDEVGWVPSHHSAKIQSTAEAFLSYNGEDAQTTYAHVPELDCPLLILEGEAAGRVTAFGFKPDRRGILDSAGNSPLKKLVVIDGADHFFSGRLELLEQAFVEWVASVRKFEDEGGRAAT